MLHLSITRQLGHYHFRIRVPADLVPILGKRELHRSLQVTGRREARKLSADLRDRATQAFTAIRHRHLMGAAIEPQTLAKAVEAFKADRAGKWGTRRH